MDKLKERLLDIKTVKIKGIKFKIRRINPLVDFDFEKIPQIFTDFISRRKAELSNKSVQDLKKIQVETYAVIKAGLVEPILVEKESDDGICVEDLFRDPEIGFTLYSEILSHSLLRFGRFKGLFFSIRTNRFLSMLFRKNTVNLQST